MGMIIAVAPVLMMNIDSSAVISMKLNIILSTHSHTYRCASKTV